MQHNEISAICRGVVARALVISEDEIPRDPWDNLIYDFAAEFSGSDLSRQQIEAEFQGRVEKWLRGLQELKAFYTGALQRHHDLYVRLRRAGTLSSEDQANYDLAMAREGAGIVKPMAEE